MRIIKTSEDSGTKDFPKIFEGVNIYCPRQKHQKNILTVGTHMSNTNAFDVINIHGGVIALVQICRPIRFAILEQETLPSESRICVRDRPSIFGSILLS